MNILRSLLILPIVTGCAVKSDREAEEVFRKHRAWLEFVVRQAQDHVNITSIYPSSKNFRENDLAKVQPADRAIYSKIEKEMKDVSIRGIQIVGSGLATKDALVFVVDSGLFAVGATHITWVNPEKSIEEFRLPNETCRPLDAPQWYACLAPP